MATGPLDHSGRARLSYIDAWGLEAARALGLPFLTGDPVFRGAPGVAFVR